MLNPITELGVGLSSIHIAIVDFSSFFLHIPDDLRNILFSRPATIAMITRILKDIIGGLNTRDLKRNFPELLNSEA